MKAFAPLLLLALAHCGTDVSLGKPNDGDAGPVGADKGRGGDPGGDSTLPRACEAAGRGEVVREQGINLGMIAAMTADASHVFYVRRQGERWLLKRVAKGGGAPETLVDRKYVGGMTLTADHVVFSAMREDGTERASWTSLFRVPKAGGAAELVTGDEDNPVSCCGRDASGAIYFGNWNGGIDSPQPDLVRLAPDGRRSVVATTLPGVASIASDGDVVLSSYGLARQLAPTEKPPLSEIWSTPALGGPSRRIYGPVEDDISRLVLANGYVYFGRTGGIVRVPIGGGPEEHVLSTLDAPYSVKMHGSYLYWMSGLSYANRTSALFRAPAAGGVVETLERDIREGYEYVIDDCAIYWVADVAGGAAILRRSK